MTSRHERHRLPQVNGPGELADPTVPTLGQQLCDDAASDVSALVRSRLMVRFLPLKLLLCPYIQLARDNRQIAASAPARPPLVRDPLDVDELDDALHDSRAEPFAVERQINNLPIPT